MKEVEPKLDRLTLKKMPSKEMLEEFINQLNGTQTKQVHFNIKKGEFEWKDVINHNS